MQVARQLAKLGVDVIEAGFHLAPRPKTPPTPKTRPLAPTPQLTQTTGLPTPQHPFQPPYLSR